ncbi:MAG: hypothetical protein P8046_00980 [Anaerolineales bacterium]
MPRKVAADSIHFYAGSSGAQRPISFTAEGKEFAVDRVLAEWRTPEGKFFLVQTQDGEIFKLHTTTDA